MSAAQPTRARQVAPLTVRSIGRPAAVTGLARLLLEIHARPVLSVVPTSTPKGNQ